MEWSGPGDFVKIRDELYFLYWLEEACNGTLGTILINLRTMHDAGIGYHCGNEGPEHERGRRPRPPRRPVRRDPLLPAQDAREPGMSSQMISTRRTLLKGGALLAAPVAVPAAAAVASSAGPFSAPRDDEAAIRRLHQDWLRRINRGDAEVTGAETIHALTPDHRGEPDRIGVAADGRRATGRFHCTVELGTELPRNSTLGQMAHAQGTGHVRRTEQRVLDVDYAKGERGWTIARIELRSA